MALAIVIGDIENVNIEVVLEKLDDNLIVMLDDREQHFSFKSTIPLEQLKSAIRKLELE